MYNPPCVSLSVLPTPVPTGSIGQYHNMVWVVCLYTVRTVCARLSDKRVLYQPPVAISLVYEPGNTILAYPACMKADSVLRQYSSTVSRETEFEKS